MVVFGFGEMSKGWGIVDVFVGGCWTGRGGGGIRGKGSARRGPTPLLRSSSKFTSFRGAARTRYRFDVLN